jgi:hypothetical protein
MSAECGQAPTRRSDNQGYSAGSRSAIGFAKRKANSVYQRETEGRGTETAGIETGQYNWYCSVSRPEAGLAGEDGFRITDGLAIGAGRSKEDEDSRQAGYRPRTGYALGSVRRTEMALAKNGGSSDKLFRKGKRNATLPLAGLRHHFITYRSGYVQRTEHEKGNQENPRQDHEGKEGRQEGEKSRQVSFRGAPAPYSTWPTAMTTLPRLRPVSVYAWASRIAASGYTLSITGRRLPFPTRSLISRNSPSFPCISRTGSCPPYRR